MEKEILAKDLPPQKRSHSPPEKSPEESRGSSDKEEEEVQSANNWEGVDLGDDERKAKFLRLMGAAKKEHKGKFVIGSATAKHGRSSQEEKSLEETLESQYEHRMADHLHHRDKRHRGLGFDESSKEPEEKNPKQEKESSLDDKK